METWSDPELGTFQSYDYGERYVQERDHFKGFEACATSRRVRLELPASSNNDSLGPPSPSVIAFTSKLLANLPVLIANGVEALWGDFNGQKQYQTGMWWHGDIETILKRISEEAAWRQELSGAEPIDMGETPADMRILYQVLSPASIKIHDETTATFEFASEIDDDGIGILTDGKAILGTGYGDDVAPFRNS